MCSEIDRFSSFLKRMSDTNNPPNFPVENKQETTRPENPPLPSSEDQDSSPEISPEIRTTTAAAEEKAEEIINEEDETDKATVSSSRESTEKQIIAEDNDGFKTPTSSEHKIPAITECPPAPRKPRAPPSRLKRKASSPPGARRRLEMDDAAAEVESIFRPVSDQDNAEDEETIKKSRKDEQED